MYKKNRKFILYIIIIILTINQPLQSFAISKFFTERPEVLTVSTNEEIKEETVNIEEPEEPEEPEDIDPPSAPTELICEDITDTTITLSWTASTDNSEGTIRYDIWDNYEYEILAQDIENTRYVLTDLLPNTTYDIVIVAVDETGNMSEPSEVLTVTTKNNIDDSINLIANKIYHSILLEWDLPVDETIDGYIIYRNGEEIGNVDVDNFRNGYLSYNDKCAYIDKDIILGDSYIYEIVPYRHKSQPNSISLPVLIEANLDTVFPTEPQNLYVKWKSPDGGVNISWDPSTDNDSIPVYEVFRDGVSQGVFSKTQYVDYDLPIGIYDYEIRAIDFSGNKSELSSILTVKIDGTSIDDHGNDFDSATIIELDQEITGKIEYYYDRDFFKFRSNASGKYKLEFFKDLYLYWGICDSNGRYIESSEEDEELIYINLDANKDYYFCVFEPILPTVYKDDTLDNHDIEDLFSKDYIRTYRFKITSPKNPPENLQAILTEGNEVILNWDPPIDNTDILEYSIYRNGEEIGKTSDTNYIDSNLLENKSYNYYVTASDSMGNITAKSNTVLISIGKDTEPPSPPDHIFEINQENNTVTFGWDGATDNVEVVGYEIYKDNEKTADTVETTYTDTGIEIGEEYLYKIKAYDAAQNISEESQPFIVIGDHGNTMELAYPINIGESIDFMINYPNDIDFFKFTTKDGGIYEVLLQTEYLKLIDLNYGSEKPIINVLDSNENLISPIDNYYWNQSYNLSGNSTYYIKVFNNNCIGQPFNLIVSKQMNPPENLRVIDKDLTTVSLEWDSPPNVEDVRYEIYRNDNRVGYTRDMSYIDKGLEPNTTYTYKVRAYTYYRHPSDYSNPVIITTDQDKTPPTIPTKLYYTEPNIDGLTIRWTKSTDNVYVEGYEVYRDNQLIGKTKENYYEDNNNIYGQKYTYTIRAYDSSGNYSDMSEPIEFYDDHGNSIETATPIDLDLLIDGRIDYREDRDCFKFLAPITGEYIIQSYGNTDVYGYIYDKSGKQLAYNDNGGGNRNFLIGINLEANQEYFVMVRHYNSRSTGNYQIKVTTPLNPPENLTVTSKNETSVTLKWDKPTEDNYILRYNIYRDGTKVGETTNTTYTDNKLYSNRQYIYEITTIYGKGNYQVETSKSEAIEVLTDIDDQAPSTPANLQIIDRNSSAIELRWNKSTDNGWIERYDIYRDGIKIDHTIDNSYEDTGLKLDTVYSYNIKAVDQAGNNSEFSNTLRCSVAQANITGITPETGTTIGGLSHKFKVYVANIKGINESSIKFEYSPDNINWESIKLNGPYNYNSNTFEKYYNVTWDLTSIPVGTYQNYYVKITLLDEAGYKDEKIYNYMVDRKLPEEPKNLKAYPSSSNIRLTWEQPPDADVISYAIYRGDTVDGIYTKIATVNGKDNLYYIDKNVEVDRTYYYKISAIDKFNQEGNKSEVASATVLRDIVPPVILGIEPVNNTILGSNANITVRAEDDDKLETIKLQYSIDGSTWIDINTSDIINNATYTWNTKWDTSQLNGEVILRAIAIDTAGNESNGEPVRTYIIDNQGPSKVENLTAKPTSTTVILKWNDVADEDFSHFVVEKKESEEGEYTQVGIVKDVLGMEVKGLKTHTAYWFRVVAYDIRGNRGIPSDEVQVITTEDTTPPIINSINPKPSRFSKEIPLEIVASDNVGVALVIIELSRDKNNWVKIAELKPKEIQSTVTLNHKLDIEREEEGPIYIRAIATDLSGNESINEGTAQFIEYIIDHTAPSKPENIKITPTAGDITINWVQNPEDDLNGYNIYKAINEVGPYDKIKEKHKYISYTDKDLLPNINYYYKITAIDIAGNESEETEPISTALMEDKEAPKILSVSPNDGITLGADPVIRVLAIDNYKLKKVSAEYKECNENTEGWTIIEEKAIDAQNDVVSFNWDTSNMRDGSYIIRIVAEDLGGNKSEEKLVRYNLNLEAPIIESFNAKEGGWSVELNWTTDETPDIHLFRIYRSLIPQNGFKLIKEITKMTENTYIDEQIAPRKYYYKLQVVDKYGNASWSEEISATPTFDDSYPPVADAGDDKSATIGMEILFDGSLSRDNDQIVYYHWDFGDGNSSNDISPMYAYDEEGTYIVNLTVKDRAGNIAEDTTTVYVYPPQEIGTLNITILEENTGVPINGASIMIEYSNGQTQKLTSNNNGNIEIIGVAGDCKIYSYKTGYMPESKETKININEITKETLFLDKGEILKGKIKVKRMTLEELKETEIDITAPENQWVYKFEAHLKYTQEQPEPIIVNGFGDILVGGGIQYIEYKDKKYKATPKVIANPNHPEVTPTFGYLLIPAEASWLKEFFSVNLMLFNSATEEFPLTDAKVTLNLPEGLTLAPTKDIQNAEIDLGTIKGQETEEVNWIIRGDKKGEYDLEAEVNANLQPFNDPIKSIFKTKDPVKVWGEDALVMHVVAEDWAFNLAPYRVYFGLENVSNFSIYNPKIVVKEGKGYKIHKIDEAKTTIEELKPGQIHWLEAVLIPNISGVDPNQPYKLDLKESYTVMTEGSTANVTTKISEIESIYTKSAREKHYGEPGIYIPTGTYTHSNTDISMTAPGFLLNISRTYNSRDEEGSVLGKGWTFGFEGSVKSYEISFELEDGTIQSFTNDIIKRVKLPDGSTMTFEKEEGTYVSKDSRAVLEKTNEGYILTTEDQYKYGFNSDGYLEYMEDRNGNKINIEVDDKGNITKVYDNLGRSFTLIYNAEGLLQSITGSKNKTITYYYENKQLKKVQDPEGQYTYYNYDENGKLEEILDNEENTIEKIAYNYEPGPDKEKVDNITDRYGNTYSYGYNNMERKVTITDSMTDKDSRQRVQWYNKSFEVVKTVDEEGNITEIDYGLYGEERKIKITTKDGLIYRDIEYERDLNGNITKTINTDKSQTQAKYDKNNNLILSMDEEGNKTYYIYDEKNINLIKKVQPLNGTDNYEEGINEENFAITRYSYYSNNTYNIKGLLQEIIDAEGNKTIYTYDKYGNIKTITNPRDKEIITSFEYDEIGLITAEISPKGYRIEYEYNNNDQLIRKIVNKGLEEEITRIIYDNLGRKIQEISPKQQDESIDNIGTRYIYYPNGLLKEQIDAEGNKTFYTYDIYGNIETEISPSGATYLYEYDEMNRLKRKYYLDQQTSQKELLEEYQYEKLEGGKLKKTHIKYLDETEEATTIYIYDYKENLIEQQNPDGTTIERIYNLNGTIQETIDENKEKAYYKYDGLGRLIEQWAPLEKEGNETIYGYKKIQYDKRGLVIKEIESKEKIKYGDLVSEENSIITEKEYYEDGKLKSIKIDGQKTQEYEYDKDGNISKTIVYKDEINKDVIEYENNHLGKPVRETRYIEKGEMFGNDILDKEEIELTTIYTYDKNGNIETITTPDGVTTSFEYNNLNRQISKSQLGEDEEGIAVNIKTYTKYGWNDEIIETIDANNNKTTFIYDNKGNLVQVVDPMCGVAYYEYDKQGRKITEITPNNYQSDMPIKEMNRIKYIYDKMDRLISKVDIYKDPETKEWKTITTKTYQYDKLGNIKEEQDALGLEKGYKKEYKYNLKGELIEELDPETKEKGLPYTIKYEYDAMGRKITETNGKGITLTYTYDNLGNVVKVTIKGEETEEQILKLNTYDLVGNILTETDGNGNTTIYQYNGFNKVKREEGPKDNTIESLITEYQYDIMGNLKKEQNNINQLITYEYDKQGRIISQNIGDIEEQEKITTTIRYDKNGNEIFTIDGNGTKIEKRYDSLNRLIETTVYITNINNKKTRNTTNYEYDKNGNQTKIIDWRNNTSINKYDPLNRLIEIIDQNGKTIEKLEYNNNSTQRISYDANGNSTSYQYDKNNRLIATIDPLGNTIKQSYDILGNIITKTDGEGHTIIYEYDEQNRLKEVKAIVSGKEEITSYTYDINGNMLSQTDAKGQTTRYEYNAINKPTKKIDNIGGEENYSYNLIGQIISKIDRGKRTTTYEYDIFGRLTKTQAGKITIEYSYDNNGNQLTMTDNTGTTKRTYDEIGRVTTKEVPNIGIVKYQYDIIENLEEGHIGELTTDPLGNQVLKIYDKVGRLKQVKAEGKTTTYNYNDNGSRKEIIYSNGQKEEYTYYGNNKLKSLINRDKNGKIIDEYTYSYDKRGNQIWKIDKKGKTSYKYDELNRLIKVEEPEEKITTYTYDLAGNRETETITIKGIKVGTLYKQVDQVFEYDELNRLIKATSQGKTTEYQYNGEGLRIAKLENGKIIERYLYEYDQIVLELDGQGNQIAKNIYGLNLIAKKVYNKEKGKNNIMYYMYNGHRDVVALIDEEGEIVGTYYYDAFGNIEEETGENNNKILYRGYQYDKETGLYYLKARHYDPKIARFMQEDTYTGDIKDPLTLNLYTYCANNPITYIDPSGHAFTDWDKKYVTRHEDREEIQIATREWIEADKRGDEAGKRAAHIRAEAVRNKYRGTDFVGRADGTTYRVGANEKKSTDKVKNIKDKNIIEDVAYIFYLPEWKREAKDDRKRIAAYYGLKEEQIYMTAVTTDEELTKAWNNMGQVDGQEVNILVTVINTHADHKGLSFGNGNKLFNSGISKLSNKDLERLILYGCNAGHLDHKENNPAMQFAKKTSDNPVIASDGTVFSSGKILWLFGEMQYKSKYDECFTDQYVDGSTRKNKGWIVYQYNNGKISITDSFGKKLTLTELLNIKKKNEQKKENPIIRGGYLRYDMEK